MLKMEVRGILRELLATIALVLWSIQLLPQVYKNYKSKSTIGVSSWAFVLWAIANVLVAANSYVNHVVIPIFLQPQVFCLLSLVCLTQCYLYPDKGPARSTWEGCLLLTAFLVICAGLETFWIYFLLTSPWRNQIWFSLLVGSIGPAITSLGFLPQIYDVITLKSTKGISLMFIFLDIGGGMAALASLALHEKFEFTTALIYIAVLALELVLLLLHVYFLHNPTRQSSIYPQSTPEHLDQFATPISPEPSSSSTRFLTNAPRPDKN